VNHEGSAGVHRLRGRHTAILAIRGSISDKSWSKIAPIVRLVSSGWQNRRYARLVILSSEASKLETATATIRKDHGALFEEGRVFGTVIETDDVEEGCFQALRSADLFE
jgi:hypothetical protein